MVRSLDYILIHELGHVMRGHLAFARRWLAHPVINETSKKSDGMPPALSRLMESQADDHATIALATKWRHLGTTHNFEQSPIQCGIGCFSFFNAADMCRSIAYSICLAFLLLDYGSITALDHVLGAPSSGGFDSQEKYPPTEFRLWRALKLSHLHEVVGVSWREILESVRASLVRAGLLGVRHLLPENASESDMETYDRKLVEDGPEVLEAERAWKDDSIDVTQPPPRPPNRIWVWSWG
jgi:hypothetical protein